MLVDTSPMAAFGKSGENPIACSGTQRARMGGNQLESSRRAAASAVTAESAPAGCWRQQVQAPCMRGSAALMHTNVQPNTRCAEPLTHDGERLKGVADDEEVARLILACQVLQHLHIGQ